jgi:hypothetical protein
VLDLKCHFHIYIKFWVIHIKILQLVNCESLINIMSLVLVRKNLQNSPKNSFVRFIKVYSCSVFVSEFHINW